MNGSSLQLVKVEEGSHVIFTLKTTMEKKTYKYVGKHEIVKKEQVQKSTSTQLFRISL